MVKLYEASSILILICYLKASRSQDISNKKEYIEPGGVYSINSPENPQKYLPGDSKKWSFSTAPGYELQLYCPIVDMPKIEDECVDYLQVFYQQIYKTYCKPFEVIGPSIILDLQSQPMGRKALSKEKMRSKQSDNPEKKMRRNTDKRRKNKSAIDVPTRDTKENGGVFACTVTSQEAPNQILLNENPPNESAGNCDCGYMFTGTPRIVGGETARINEFPSMAYVRTILDDSGDYYACGATIIAPPVAITAAHCVIKVTDPNSYQLIVGEYDTSRRDETEAERLMAISDIIIHNHYDPSSHGVNDIALLITAEEIRFTPKVGPACLPFNIDKESIIGKDVIAAGWGLIEPKGPVTDVLQEVRLQVDTDLNCRDAVDIYYIQSQHMCTISARESVAEGDSGGPLYYIDPKTDRYVLVGVTSFGNINEPGTWDVFMYVHHYLPWISENLPSDTQICGDPN